ncbi:MAG TPA: hypothetical protein VL979_02885 [Solirubrobacteraceae bacterium]|nr:hypothetical protein [Solirubrobacteraceae bacterium]
MDDFNVPADLAVQLRGALYAEVSRWCSDLETMSATTIPGDVAPAVSNLRAVLAVLDDIGWDKTTSDPDALTIDGRHFGIVIETLEREREGREHTAESPQLEDLPGRERAKATADLIWRFVSDELCRHTGDELLEILSPEVVIELVEALRDDGRALAPIRRAKARHVPSDRAMKMLRARLIDQLTLEQIAARHGVTKEIVRRALVDHFGIRGRRRW